MKHNRTFYTSVCANTHFEIHLAGCSAAKRRGSASARVLPSQVKGHLIHWEGPESVALHWITHSLPTASDEMVCKSAGWGISAGAANVLDDCGGFRVRCKHTHMPAFPLIPSSTTASLTVKLALDITEAEIFRFLILNVDQTTKKTKLRSFHWGTESLEAWGLKNTVLCTDNIALYSSSLGLITLNERLAWDIHRRQR